MVLNTAQSTGFTSKEPGRQSQELPMPGYQAFRALVLDTSFSATRHAVLPELLHHVHVHLCFSVYVHELLLLLVELGTLHLDLRMGEMA